MKVPPRRGEIVVSYNGHNVYVRTLADAVCSAQGLFENTRIHSGFPRRTRLSCRRGVFICAYEMPMQIIMAQARLSIDTNTTTVGVQRLWVFYYGALGIIIIASGRTYTLMRVRRRRHCRLICTNKDACGTRTRTIIIRPVFTLINPQ